MQLCGAWLDQQLSPRSCWHRPGSGGARCLPECLDYEGAGLSTGAERLATITTRVQFVPLTAAEIEAYVATGEPLQCAGGFALEGHGGALV